MSANTSSTSKSNTKWLSITTAIIISGGILFLTLTTITAYATRSLIQTQFDASNQQIVKLHNLNGGLNWSHLKFGVDVTAIEIDMKMQHFVTTTYIQGQILDNKISSTPLATFTGYIDLTFWNGNIQFDIQANAPELNYNELPNVHATALTINSTGTLKNNQLDSILNVTSDSNYGPLRVMTSLQIPNQKTIMLWHTTQIQLHTILPLKLWETITKKYPIIKYILTTKGMIKQQAEVVIINVKLEKGIWQPMQHL